MTVDTSDLRQSVLERQPFVFELSDVALSKILELRAAESDADELGLRIEITGTQGVDYTYDLSFEVVSEADASDIAYSLGKGLMLLVSDRDASRLNGASLGLPANTAQPGLVLRNPNRPDLGPNAKLELQGSLEDKIHEILTKRINPAIASHGGYAELVSVEGSNAVIRLAGGCQGCGMAGVTIAAGIEKTLRELLPEIEQVIDVTDHDSGTNPYYT